MLLKTMFIAFFISSVVCRHVLRFSDLDEDDQILFRAAYDTPNYDHDEYQQNDDLPLGKLDLLKDGLWAIKAKLKELKMFNKALAANLLATKLKLKELVANSIIHKKHHISEVDMKKRVNNYQMPSYPQHSEPHEYAPAHPYDPYYGQ